MENKLQKLYLKYYNLLVAQDLWQTYYQLLSIIFLRELNVNTGKMIKNVKLSYEVCDCFLKHTKFNDDLIEYKGLCCNKNYQENFDEKLKLGFHYGLT